MTQPRSVYLPAGRMRLHAKVWEHPMPTLPPLMILHGIFESWRSFASFGERFAGERTVYSLDLRGHGLSSRPVAGYRFADYANDVLCVLAVLEQAGESEVDLLGHSLGANVALFAASRGDRALGRIVVVDPPVVLASDWPFIRDMMRREWALSRLPVAEIVASMRGSAATAGRDVAWLEMLAADLAGTADGVFAAMAEGEQGEVDWASLLGRISVGTLAVGADPGKAGAQLVGERLDVLRRGVPHAQVHVVPGAAHHVEVDRPEVLFRLVDEFTRAGRG
jgi:pimeloyl-ACP methyl ester carboxylesterase